MTQPPSPWTDERVAKLRELWADKHSMSEIAAALGLPSRNSVASKIRQLGLQRRLAPRPKKRSPRPRVMPSRLAFLAAPTFAGPKRPPVMPEPEPVDGPMPDSRCLPLFRLDMQRHCRWPIGHPRTPQFVYCAADREHPGNDTIHVYCAAHFRLARNDHRGARGGEHDVAAVTALCTDGEGGVGKPASPQSFGGTPSNASAG